MNMRVFLLLNILIFNFFLQTEAQQSNWEEQEDYVNGYAIVTNLGKVSVIDKNQKLISDFIFQDARDFHNHRAAAKQNDLWGFINEHAQTILPFNYEIVFNFNDTVTVVSKSGNWWLIDFNGKILKKLDITLCYGFENGEAIVFKNDQKGIMDTKGNIVYEKNAPKISSRPSLPPPPSWRPASVSTCPANLDFEYGNFTNWRCDTGTCAVVGTANVVTVKPCAPIPGRHTIIPTVFPSAIDPFGLFPTNSPNGSNFAVKLGSTLINKLVERISYTFHVPANDSNFSFRYDYAVVLQNPNHTALQQPRFTAKLIDSATKTYLDCASFEYVASSNLPGFLNSLVDPTVVYKDWSSVYISLRGYAGKTVYLEFTSEDCTLGKHWGYAYLDVEDLCGQSIQVNYQCDSPQNTTLTGPPGFQYYNWWDQGFKNFLGSGQVFTLNPRPTKSGIYNLQVVPYPGFGCTDTMQTYVYGTSSAQFSASDTIGICTPHSFTFYHPNKNYLNALWDFGDGTTAVGDTVSHTFNSVGIYPVSFTTTDSGGCISTNKDTVKILQPTASLNYTAGNFCNSNSVQLNVTTTNIDSLFWNFGDGNFLDTLPASISHIYSKPGKFVPTLIAKSNHGCQIPLSGKDSIGIEHLIPGFNSNSQNQCASTNVTFTDTSVSIFGITSWLWNFGDGTVGNTQTATHSYTQQP